MSKYLFSIGLAFILLILSGCSKTSELLSELPADVKGVIKVDVRKLCMEAGCKIEGDDIIFSDDIKKLISNSDLQASTHIAEQIFPYIHSDEIFGFIPSTSSDIWFVSKCKDTNGLKKFFNDNGYIASENKKLTFYSSSSGSWFINDGSLWWTSQSNPQFTPNDFKESCKSNGNIGEIPGVGDFLRRPGILKIAFSLTNNEKQWVCSDLTISKEDIGMEISRINEFGTPVENKEFKNINSDFLRYIPDNYAFISATGLTDKIDWKSLGFTIGLIGGFQSYGFYEAILPILKSIDGTIALAVTPSEENITLEPDFSQWRFILMAQMKRNDALKTITTLRNYVTRFGLPLTFSSPDKIQLNFNEVKYSVEYTGGFLILSNSQPTLTSKHRKEKDFQGKQLYINLELTEKEVNEIATNNVDYGFSFNISTEKEKSFLTIKLPGSKKPILETLVNMLAQ